MFLVNGEWSIVKELFYSQSEFGKKTELPYV